MFLVVDRYGLPQASFRRNLFTGFVFGLVTVLVIELPVKAPLGTTFDTRAAPVLIVGYVAGPVAGMITAVFGAAARLHVGGPFALGGALSPFLYLTAALIYRRFRGEGDPDLRQFLGLALLGTILVTPSYFVDRPFDGALEAVLMSWLPVLVGNLIGVALLGVIFQQMLRQVERKKQLELLMGQLSDQLHLTIQVNRSKDLFLANMSHELRTPLNAIIGFASMIEDPPDRNFSEDRARRYAGNIRKSGGDLAEMINDVLDLTKMEAGETSLTAKSIEPARLVNEVCEHLAPLAQKKQMDLKAELGADDKVVVDPVALKQCITNVVGNSIKYCPPGRAVTISGFERDDQYVIRVKDQGQGIPEDLIKRIGEPFLRGGDPYTRSIEGTGLGLAITKRLLERQNGQLDISSKPSEGTEVQMILKR